MGLLKLRASNLVTSSRRRGLPSSVFQEPGGARAGDHQEPGSDADDLGRTGTGPACDTGSPGASTFGVLIGGAFGQQTSAASTLDAGT
jgi:hypothetical protein